MLESILNTVFSIPYLLIGTGLAAFLDFKIRRTKATTQFTSLEIWGCAVAWPLLVVTIAAMYFDFGDN